MKRPTLRRIHIWLGWLIGVPLLIWTVTGLWMAARPIEEVRGEHLRRPPAQLRVEGPVTPPATDARPIRSLTLEQRPDGPVWVIAWLDGGARAADARTGALLPPIDAAQASALARAAYAGEASVTSVTRTSADAPPLDLRRPRPAWAVRFGDGTRIYVDAESGSVLALRTGQWRWFDFMWGLHIMDLQTREDTSHPILIGFAALAVIGTILGLVLLPMTSRRRRSREP